jgi:erythromycin esterase
VTVDAGQAGAFQPEGTGLPGSAAGAAPRPVSCAPDAPLRDLAALLADVGTAAVVGLGAACRGARELWAHQHRALVHLVEHHGFRSLALEEDWTLCLEFDRYVCSGEGDLPAVLAASRSLWCTRELLTTLSWIRARNAASPDDPVRVVGLNADSTRAAAYDVVADYIRSANPPNAGAILAALARLHPGHDIAGHIWRYRSLPDRRDLLDTARRLNALMADLEPHPRRALALRHCAAIADFYEYHDKEPGQVLAYAAPRMAENLLRWHEHTGHRIAYWGGIAHTLTATERVLSDPALSGRSTGSRLRELLAGSYVSIGLTMGQGHVPQLVPPAAPGLSEALLDTLSPHEAYAIPLKALSLTSGQTTPPPALRSAPAALRVVGPGYTAESDPGCVMTGGSLADWFDIVIHTRRVTPTTPLRDEHAPDAPRTRNWKEDRPSP